MWVKKLQEEKARLEREIQQQKRVDKAIHISQAITSPRSIKQSQSTKPHKGAAEELRQSATDEKSLIQQLLNQQLERERNKSPSDSPPKRDGNLDQKLANLKSAMTEFYASVKKLKETQRSQPATPPPKPKN